MNLKRISIAIDGPAASGKSTTAKLVAKALHYLHIDTGAMYRAITLKVLENQVAVNDLTAISALAEHSSLEIFHENGIDGIKLDGRDVTGQIRTQRISKSVSAVSAIPEVRKILVREQQKLSAEGGVVLEGRDIGTVVLPHAELKIFMTAGMNERARRRTLELADTDMAIDVQEMIRQIEERDWFDSSRDVSPLKPASESVLLDTSTLSIDEQVEFVVQRAREIIHRLSRPTVSIDQSSGFCWGVVRTVDIAEKELRKSGELFALGEIIHNPMEIERLEKEGLSTLSVEQLDRLKKKHVLIRAHGEPPSTYLNAAALEIEIVDATCPVVKKVQERIRNFYRDGFQVIIFGKKEHAETIGLIGQTEGTAVVVKSVAEAESLQLNRKSVLFSQTTMDKSQFYEIAKILKKKAEELKIEFFAKDTICGQVSGREKKIRDFSKANEVIIFVAGKHSSNGKVLFEIVKSENVHAYFIESPNELDINWFDQAHTVGITGATSTPQWLMEKTKKAIEDYSNSMLETMPS
jgi:(E)-4-hydroxy-3-methyl-but-2-enyl pyrophosphate reductase/cytidylate kinase